jgi:hypothetical protein
MGQYREWLSYRDIDQKLQEQIAQLEQEVEQLQKQAQELSEQSQPGNNFIVQAIDRLLHPFSSGRALASHNTLALQEQESGLESASESKKGSLVPPRPSYHHKPSPLFSMSLLPDLDIMPREPSLKPTMLEPLAPAPVEQPTEKITPVKRRTPLPPQLFLPYQQPADWPRDQQSMRTNQIIERWIERWSRYPANTTQGDGDDA